MKKYVVLTLLSAVIVSCIQDDYGIDSLYSHSISTRAVITQVIDSAALRDSVYSEYFVPYSDVQLYAKIHCNGEVGDSLDSIVPLTDGVDTLMYLVQYKNGWDIIAADKRGPLIIAMSEDGRFASNDTLPGFQIYLDAQKMYLKSMRYIVENNITSDAFGFWSMLHPKDMPSSRTLGNGYWEMYDSESETTIEKSGHMIRTKWGQSDPWDQFVPYDNDRLGMKCAVGCVAVAGAQMSYYLHYKLGYPRMMCTSGYCVGDNKNYTQFFSNPSPDAWDNMALTKWEYATEKIELSALLMAFVGSVVDMNYDESSGAHTEDLVYLFDEMGLYSTYANYNSTIAWQSLKNDMPVIVSATRIDEITSEPKGHAWIMDGWKTITTRYTNYYGWVDSTWQDIKPMDPIAPALVRPDDMIKYRDFKTTTNTVVSKSVLMNWGWDGVCDDIYCTLDGAWAPDVSLNYQYGRMMIHGFEVKE